MDRNFNSGDSRAGRGMLWLAAIGALVILTLGFQSIAPERGGIVKAVNEAGRTMVVLRRDRSGHYLAEGAINGRQVEFLVDTGATDVAVSEALARELALDFGPEVVVMTAGGPARAWITRLDSVSIGGLSIGNVRATITPALGDEPLLGMAFLKHFSIVQQGDELIISTEPGGGA